jgi:hypothetical protein
LLFTNGGTCLSDFVQCFLGLQIPSLQSARQTPKYCFLVGQVCCIHNIPRYRLTLAEHRQPKLPSSNQLHHLVLRHLSQVVKNPLCSGFKPRTSQTRVRRSNHYTIELTGAYTVYLLLYQYGNMCRCM